MAHIFGPVHSRRLGYSLGIDLLPFKTCNFDCGYCECGATTRKIGSREAWVPVDEVMHEVAAWMGAHTQEEKQKLSLTFAGAGEPTLHSGFGELARRLKGAYPDTRLTLITNAYLFTDPGVRRDAGIFDLVLPSLDAARQETFERINRPLAGYRVDELIEGLALFRREYTGKIWLEIFIIHGVNDRPDELALLRKAVIRIAPDRVQINSLDRPGTDTDIQRPGAADLQAAAQALAIDGVEIISRGNQAQPQSRHGAQESGGVGE